MAIQSSPTCHCSAHEKLWSIVNTQRRLEWVLKKGKAGKNDEEKISQLATWVPVPMLRSWIAMWFEDKMLIPSPLGLDGGATMLRLERVAPLQKMMARWPLGLWCCAIHSLPDHWNSEENSRKFFSHHSIRISSWEEITQRNKMKKEIVSWRVR